MPKENRPAVRFILSVDTEEEFEWGGRFPQKDCDIENIKQIPKFQAFCDQLGVRPTYLVDYPVASDKPSAAIFRSIVEQGKAEVGAHLHPWCNPPLTEANGEYESHVSHLADDLIRSKLNILTDIIYTNIGVTPSSFRTGRWGTDEKVMRALVDSGYIVDSSMIPLYENDYFSFTDCSNQPYWPDLKRPCSEGEQRRIFEVPVSSGFTRSNYRLWQKIHKWLSGRMLRHLHLIGLLWRLQIVKKVYLSPELANTKDMNALVWSELQNKHTVFHMFLHSSSLLSGKSQYSRSSADVMQLYQRIEEVVQFLEQKANVTFCTISECARELSEYVDK